MRQAYRDCRRWGAVLREENRRALATACNVVWLSARVDTIAARIASDATTAARRPNLLTGGEDEIRQLLAARTPLYQAAATIEVTTDDRSPSDIACEIIERLELRGPGQASADSRGDCEEGA